MTMFVSVERLSKLLPFLSLILLLVPLTSIYAQEISAPLSTVTTNKTTYYTGDIVLIDHNIKNTSNTPVEFKGKIEIIISDNVIVSNRVLEYKLGPYQSDFTSFIWTIPQNAKTGHYEVSAKLEGGPDLKTATAEHKEGQDSKIKIYAGTGFFHAGTAKQAASIVLLTSDKTKYSSGDGAMVTLKVKNDGNSPLDVNAVVDINDPSNRIRYNSKASFGITTGAVTSRDFTWETPEDVPSGKYEIRATITDSKTNKDYDTATASFTIAGITLPEVTIDEVMAILDAYFQQKSYKGGMVPTEKDIFDKLDLYFKAR
jgi:hypothetical protein